MERGKNMRGHKKRKMECFAPHELHLEDLILGDSCGGVLTNVMSHISLSDMNPYVAACTCRWILALYRNNRCKLWSQLHARSGDDGVILGPPGSTRTEQEAHTRCNALLRANLIDLLAMAKWQSKDFQENGFRILTLQDGCRAHIPDGTV